MSAAFFVSRTRYEMLMWEIYTFKDCESEYQWIFSSCL